MGEILAPFMEDLQSGGFIVPPSAIIIFGATGDLSTKKLLPAIYNLAADGFLPDRFLVVGASRRPLSDDEFRDVVINSVNLYSRAEISESILEVLLNSTYYHQVRFDHYQDFLGLRAKLEKISQEKGGGYNFIFYLATLPEFFGEICSRLNEAGFVENSGTFRNTRVIIEKPFGHDLESAKQLNMAISTHFREDQIYRIDHYLGKETVQNIMAFRFANGLFEPLWNNRYVDHIEITVAESIGISKRAEYFDSTGILRDIVQNHILQMMSLLCIEPPISMCADDIREEKVKVLRSITTTRPNYVEDFTIRAQYRRGIVDGEEVVGYLEEEGVKPNSQTETYTALKLDIDNWRWHGVPIFIRTGKRLPKKITELALVFKSPPSTLFREIGLKRGYDNVLAIQIQPKEGISLAVSAKPPGPHMRVVPVVMEFNYGFVFGIESQDAYERLLLDAMKGDQTLFTRNDEVEEAWRIIDPVVNGWKEGRSPLYYYKAGTWGPKEAAILMGKYKRRWRRL